MNLRIYTLNSRNGLKPEEKNGLLHGAFRVRYLVYHDEMGLIPENMEKELHDEYDFIEPTSIFVVLDREVPVGTLRLTRYSEEFEIPIFRTFREELEERLDISNEIRKGRKFAEASRFTVLGDYRHGKAYVPAVLTCAMYERCIEDGITDVLIVANPAQKKLYESAGFTAFAIKRDNLTGIVSPAMHAEIRGILGQFIKYLNSKLKRDDLIQTFGGSGRIRQEVINL